MRPALLVAALLGLLLPVAPAAAQAASGAVAGSVHDERSGAALAGAVVEVVDVRPGQGVRADSLGGYRLPAVPAGRRILRVQHLGYAPLELEVVVPGGREVRLDIALRAAPLTLAPLRVQAGGVGAAGRSATDSIAAPAAELAPASARALQSSPGLVEVGVADAVRPGPGQEPVDPGDVLYVRGAGSDLKLVYLDGAPVYAPFPLGGILDPFTPGLLHTAQVHLGGAPARYDGGLSYVLDLRTRAVNPETARSAGAVDLLSARALVETPLGGRGGVLLAGRAVHGLGVDRLVRGPFPYGYREGLARGDVEVGGGGLVTATVFHNGEQVGLDDDPDRARYIAWGNTAGSLRYRGSVLGSAAELTASFGDFEATLPLQGERPATAAGASRHLRISADFGRSMHGLRLRYGLSVDRQRQAYQVRSTAADSTSVRGGQVSAAGGYLDAGWQLSPALHLRGGLRAEHFSLPSQFRLAPRLAASWLLSERAKLTLAAGRYHQYLRPPTAMLLADDSLQASPAQPLVLGSASHFALSLDQEVTGGVRLGVEGFFKSFQDVPGSASSDANASGVDVWVRRAAGAWTGWMGYSLAWTWAISDDPEDPRGTRFAGRQLLTSGVSAPLGRRGRLDAGLVYGAGLPYTSIPLQPSQDASLRNGAAVPTSSTGSLQGSAGDAPLLPLPDRPYLRLDLAASHTWSARWGGAPVEVSPYLRVLNTLGQRDALFYRFDPDHDEEPRALLNLPVVPVLGVEWRF